jgi:Sulfotransferase family
MRIVQSAGRAWLRQLHSWSRLSRRLRTGAWPPQIVFLHIPKTGGSSVQKEFVKHIGSNRSGRSALFDSIYAEPDAAQIARAQASRYVGGHLDWSTFERFRQPGAFVFTVLREPFDRLLSSYLYLTNFPSDSRWFPQIAHLQGMDIEDFLRSEDPIARVWSDNVLARQFGGSFRMEQVDEAALARSLAHLRSLSYVGFQHRLDADLRVIATGGGIPAPAKAGRENVTGPDARKPEVTGRMKGELAPLVVQKLFFDRQIYQAMLEG